MAVINHSEHLGDRAKTAATRAYLALQPRLELIPENRPQYADLIGASPSADDVMSEQARVGGVDGWWCRPTGARSEGVLLHLHGGAYVLGSAESYSKFASHVASAARLETFVPDYSLAPERPFPAALDDIHAVLRGLRQLGFERVAVSGDSAGGGLALAIVQDIVGREPEGMPEITGVAVMSPWTDMTLTSRSMTERASSDPLLSREQLEGAVRLYAQGEANLRDPRISPIFGAKVGLPPLMVHVGQDEVLLDDAVGYVEAAEAVGVIAEVHIWEGMTHVFPASSQTLRAAAEAIDLVAAFLQGSMEGRS